jgi:MtrB/PioB family decaheme-associated outer membrane protein
MTTRFAVACALAVFGLGLPGAGRADGHFTLGSQWWTQTVPEAKYQEFRQVPRGAFLESFFVTDTAYRSRFTLYGANLIQRNQSAGLMAARGVRLRADLTYRQIPHLFSDITRTPYTQIAPGVFLLPDSLQSMNQKARNDSAYQRNMTDLLNTAPRVPLGFRTDISEARLRGRPAMGVQFELRGSRRLRAGSKAYGASLGFNNAIELLEPIDQRMLDVDAIANFTRDRLTLRAVAGLSAFDNRVNALRWDNPKRLTDSTYASAYTAGNGTSQGQLDLYPDNRLYRTNVSLGLRLPRRSVFTATLGGSHGTQDDAWLPFTVNTAIPQFRIDSLPGRSTNAKVTTFSQDYRLTSRLTSGVSGTLRYRGYQYDNHTPEHVFPGQVRLDQVWEPGAIETRPYSNRQNTWGADADFSVIRGIGVSATYEYRQRARTLRESDRDRENAVSVRARATPISQVELVASTGYADRKLDHFSEAEFREGGVLVEQPGMRRFDIADRRQNTVDAALTWSPLERVDVMVEYAFLQNKYPHSQLGLEKERNDQVTAEATLHASEAVDLSGGYGFGRLVTDQAARQSAASVSLSDTATWTAKLDDQSVFAFAHGDWRPAPRVTVSGDYVFSRSHGTFELGRLSPKFLPAPQDLPGTHFNRHTLSLEARYKVMESTELGVRYGFDQFKIIDFWSQGIPLLGATLSPTSLTSSGLFLGNNTQNYRAHAVAVVATRLF